MSPQHWVLVHETVYRTDYDGKGQAVTMRIMTAAKGALTPADAPIPTAETDHVVIKVLAAGVNRADLLQVAGSYPSPAGWPSWPGLEACGVVVETGPGVDAFSPGDRVVALTGGGSYAEYVAVPQGLCLPAPAGLDDAAAGGLMEAACTVWSAFDGVALEPGDTVVIHGGSGGIGTFAIQWARLLGLRVFTTAGGEERARRCENLGAQRAFDYRSASFSATVRDAGGASLILDVVGGPALAANIDALALGGTIVCLGFQAGSRGELDLRSLMGRQGRITSTALRARPLAQKERIVRGVGADMWGHIPDALRPIIDRRLPLHQAALAHEALRRSEVFGKVVLVPGEAE